MSIPKIIHYCWFGGKPLPKYAKKNIASWQKYFPAYEICEWNEENFDVNMIPYTEEAYKKGKYAFVSDFARYWILYNFGGIYFDTDVEVINSFEDIIKKGSFMGIEKEKTGIFIAPGLGMGATPQNSFYKEMIDFYSSLLQNEDTTVEPYLVSQTTSLFKKKGLVGKDLMQTIEGITIYPNEYFNPLDDYTGHINITSNTRSIHYYAKSWIDGYSLMRKYLSRKLHLFINIRKK